MADIPYGWQCLKLKPTNFISPVTDNEIIHLLPRQHSMPMAYDFISHRRTWMCYMYWYLMVLRTCLVSAIECITHTTVVKTSFQHVLLFLLKTCMWCSSPSNLHSHRWCEDNIDFRIAVCPACSCEVPRKAGTSAKHSECMYLLQWVDTDILSLWSFVYISDMRWWLFFFTHPCSREKIRSNLYVSRHGFND